MGEDREAASEDNDAKEIPIANNQETESDLKKRETHNALKDLKILTAIMLGKDRNKELSSVLDTDKSFTSKQIKSLQEKGLVRREGEGKNVRYEVDKFNLLKFLQLKVVIKWKKEE